MEINKLHIINEIKASEVKTEIGGFNEAVWYHGICSPEEISRILNVQNANDYVLKLRADIIADNARLYRVFLNLSRKYGKEWSLEKYFTSYSYINIKNSMDVELRRICDKVAYGSIISSDPNGLIFESEYGTISTYSISLKYFSYYSSLALLELDGKVPFNVRFQAMRIAIRVMLQREALDFVVDPRGIVPQDINSVIKQIFPSQADFIVAHEYSHLINGDLTTDSLHKCHIIQSHFEDQTDYKKINAYNSDQNKEFKADIGAFTYPHMNSEHYSYYYYTAMLWFAALAIFEAAENCIFPPYGHQSHPGAKARYNNILENAPRPIDFNEQLYYKEIPQMVSMWEKLIIEDVSLNYDYYEMYGSAYLAKPNTEWRGRELIDRVDY